MVTDFIRARDVLVQRMRDVFTPETFGVLYPETEKVPSVYLGFPTTEPPFYVAVDEIVDAAATSGAATMGRDRVDFTLHVWLSAQHTELARASDALLCYIDAVFGSIMADPQLCNTVENSFPQIESAGTAADSSKRYIAAALVGIECSVWTGCQPLIATAVAASNGKLAR